METFETVIDGACEDQRADLKIFAATGDRDALARTHFGGCVDCDHAVEKLIELRENALAAQEIVVLESRRRIPVMALVGLTAGCATFLGILGLMGYMVYDSARHKSADERYGSAVEDVSYVKDARVGICYAVDHGDIHSFGQVSCQAVADRLESGGLHFYERIAYFKEGLDGQCFAWLGFRGYRHVAPVTCTPEILTRLNARSESGRFFIEPGR